MMALDNLVGSPLDQNLGTWENVGRWINKLQASVIYMTVCVMQKMKGSVDAGQLEAMNW